MFAFRRSSNADRNLCSKSFSKITGSIKSRAASPKVWFHSLLVEPRHSSLNEQLDWMRKFVPRVICHGCRDRLRKKTRFQTSRFLTSITVPSVEAAPQLERDSGMNRLQKEPEVALRPEWQSNVRFATVMNSGNTSEPRTEHSPSNHLTFHFGHGCQMKFIQFSKKEGRIIYRLHYPSSRTRAPFQGRLKRE